MARVHRLDVEHVLDQGGDGAVAVDGQSFPGTLPYPHGKERLGLDVVRVLVNDRLKVAHHFAAAILFGLLGVGPIVDFAVNPELLVFAGLVPAFFGFLDEALGAFGVVAVGHGHAPVGHCAVGVEHCRLPETALGLEVPKAVQLGDALREKQLSLLHGGRDREAHAPHALHEIGALAGTLVEGFAVERVALEYLLFAINGLVFSDHRLQADGENHGNIP